MIDVEKIRVLLWSFKQGCFHYETLGDTMRSGLEAYANKNAFQDYIVLGVHEDQAVLDRLRDNLVAKFGHHDRAVEKQELR